MRFKLALIVLSGALLAAPLVASSQAPAQPDLAPHRITLPAAFVNDAHGALPIVAGINIASEIGSKELKFGNGGTEYFRYGGRAGEAVTFQLPVASAPFSLEVRDAAAGTVLATSAGRGAGAAVSTTLPKDGDYLVVVRGSAQALGAFELTTVSSLGQKAGENSSAKVAQTAAPPGPGGPSAGAAGAALETSQAQHGALSPDIEKARGGPIPADSGFGFLDGLADVTFFDKSTQLTISKQNDGQELVLSYGAPGSPSRSRVVLRKTARPGQFEVPEFVFARGRGPYAASLKPDGSLLVASGERRQTGMRYSLEGTDTLVEEGVDTTYGVVVDSYATNRYRPATEEGFRTAYAGHLASEERREQEAEAKQRRRDAQQQALYNTLKGQLAVATENERRSSSALQDTISDLSNRAAQQRQSASAPRPTSPAPSPQSFPAPSPQAPPRSVTPPSRQAPTSPAGVSGGASSPPAATPVRQATASSGRASASTGAACTEKTGEREIFGLIEFKREDALASLMETKTIGPIYDVQCTQPNATGVLKGWWKCTGKASNGLTVKVCPNTGPQSASRQ